MKPEAVRNIIPQPTANCQAKNAKKTHKKFLPDLCILRIDNRRIIWYNKDTKGKEIKTMYEIEIIYRGEQFFIYGYSVADACRRRNIDRNEVKVLFMDYID